MVDVGDVGDKPQYDWDARMGVLNMGNNSHVCPANLIVAVIFGYPNMAIEHG